MFNLLISKKRARGIALKEVTGDIIGESLDMKYDIYIYKFYISTEDNKTFKVEVNAKSGKVLKVKKKED